MATRTATRVGFALLLLLFGATAAARPVRLRGAEVVIRGLDGQRSLRVALPERPEVAVPVNRAQGARLMREVSGRFPGGAGAEARYARLALGDPSSPPVDLDELLEARAGWCRERAVHLIRLLGGLGVDARLRYGEVFRPGGKSLGGHAWVEARLEGRWMLLDPSVYRTPRPLRHRVLLVEEAGALRRRRVVVGPRAFFLPTNDLVLDRAMLDRRDAAP